MHKQHSNCGGSVSTQTASPTPHETHKQQRCKRTYVQLQLVKRQPCALLMMMLLLCLRLLGCWCTLRLLLLLLFPAGVQAAQLAVAAETYQGSDALLTGAM
jgi:hypothetical protein